MQTAFYEIMKAVLVIDMPKTCKECKCQLCWVCVPADEDIDEYIDPSKAKPDWCPLRQIPDKPAEDLIKGLDAMEKMQSVEVRTVRRTE